MTKAVITPAKTFIVIASEAKQSLFSISNYKLLNYADDFMSASRTSKASSRQIANSEVKTSFGMITASPIMFAKAHDSDA